MGSDALRPSRSAADICQIDIDPQVIGRALAGDVAAQEMLWRQILVLVVKLARIICRGTQDCDIDDVIQAALFALIKRTKRLRDIRNWPAYVRRIITNCVIDNYRKNHPHDGWFSLDAAVDEDAGNPTSLGCLLPGPDNVLEEVAVRELHERLNRFLDTFPKEQAAVFRLYLQKCSYKNIADKVGCPVNTVGTWVNRIKIEIREWLRSSDEQRFA
jgi:RNA polymerase sigma factor (sigma-70 family)